MTLARKTPMKRSPLRSSRPVGVLAQASFQRVRSKRCVICRESFEPARPGMKVCGPVCSEPFAVALRAKAERKADKAQREKLKTRQQWLKEAQAVFNSFIRARDADLPCISCGRFHGGSYDAGHFRSVGAQPALRFDEKNVHKQCVPCNQHKGGNAVEYRIRLVKKIGVESVELLEIEHEPTKYTIEDAKRIKAIYRAKLKAILGDRKPAPIVAFECDWADLDITSDLDDEMEHE